MNMPRANLFRWRGGGAGSNQRILNRPGPIFIGQDLFVKNLARAFRLVSNYDSLVGVDGAASTPLQ
jgi:hypothetical protein